MNKDYFIRIRELAPDWPDEIANTERLALVLRSPKTKERDKEISTMRNLRMAFSGSTVPPGRTADLLLPNETIVRVVNDSATDLRPQAVIWSAVAIGRFCGYVSENSLVFLEVDEKHFFVLDKS